MHLAEVEGLPARSSGELLASLLHHLAWALALADEEILRKVFSRPRQEPMLDQSDDTVRLRRDAHPERPLAWTPGSSVCQTPSTMDEQIAIAREAARKLGRPERRERARVPGGSELAHR